MLHINHLAQCKLCSQAVVFLIQQLSILWAIMNNKRIHNDKECCCIVKMLIAVTVKVWR